MQKVEREQLEYKKDDPWRADAMSSRAMSKWGGPVRGRGKPVLTANALGHAKCTTYTNTHPHQLYRMRLAGLPVQKIADIFLVSTVQLYRWKKEYPDFAEAWDEGGDHADGLVAQAMFQRAVGYEHVSEKIAIDTKTGFTTKVPYVERFAPDTAAAEFWLTNRQGKVWKKRNSTEITGADGEPLMAPTIMINPVMSLNQLAPIIDMQAEDVTEEEEPYVEEV